MTTNPSDLPTIASIAQLKSTWTQLNDVDRAYAVAALRRTGISNRKIAPEVGSCESNLRHLLKVLDASREDQELARNQQITTTELIRRGQAAKQQRAEKQREVKVAKNARSASRSANLICNWIIKQRIAGPDGELIIAEVLRKIRGMEMAGLHPPIPKQHNLTVDQIIERARPAPAEMIKDDNSSDALYVKWLCIWAYYAFPDAQIRDDALEQAHERQWRR